MWGRQVVGLLSDSLDSRDVAHHPQTLPPSSHAHCHSHVATFVPRFLRPPPPPHTCAVCALPLSLTSFVPALSHPVFLTLSLSHSRTFQPSHFLSHTNTDHPGACEAVPQGAAGLCHKRQAGADCAGHTSGELVTLKVDI